MENDYVFENGIKFPSSFMHIKYNGKVIPSDQPMDMFAHGANCQVFAYEILRINNFEVPNYRSSELWDDKQFSKLIESDFEACDILFFNKTKKSYGAHLGVYVGNGEVIHNSLQIGKPVIWSIEECMNKEQYKILLGAKRFRKKDV